VLNGTAYVSPQLTARVKQAVDELDYTMNHLAHALQTKSTRTIGILMPGEVNPDPFFGEVVRGAEDVFRKKDYLLIVGHTYNQVAEQSRYLAAFRARLVDGVLLFQAPGRDPPRIVEAQPGGLNDRRSRDHSEGLQRARQNLPLPRLRSPPREREFADHPHCADRRAGVQLGTTSFGVTTAQQNQPRRLQAAIKIVF
jgi:hypothetical protein